MNDAQEKKPVTGRWRWVLAISLGLNLLFVGLVAGAMLRADGKDRRGGPDRAEMRGFGAPYMRELPRQERRALFEGLRDAGVLPNRADRRAGHEALIVAMRAQPFDPSELEVLLRAQAEQMMNVREAVQGAWLRRVSMMTDAERAAYADRLEKRVRWGYRKER